MNEELNCMNCSIGDFKRDLCDCNNGFCKEFKSIGKQEDFFNAVMQRIRPQDDDWEKYSDKLWKNAYERGKADGAMIYGNEHNCIMTIFGECSYAETGCGDCAVVEKVRKALSADRPQDDEFKNFDRGDLIALIEAQKERIGELLADRPQGEWIDGSGGIEGAWNYCSVCGEQAIDLYDYCPNCGARMKGADDETN